MALGTEGQDIRNGTIWRTQGKAKETPKERAKQEEERLPGLQGPRLFRLTETSHAMLARAPGPMWSYGNSRHVLMLQVTTPTCFCQGSSASTALPQSRNPWLQVTRGGLAGHEDGDAHGVQFT